MLHEMIKRIKSLCETPSAEKLALQELEETKRELLKAQSAREYADSLCKYHEARIKRLTAYLHTATEEK
jgi:hypothetical protein